jgi:hypothetical protein
MSLCSAQFSPEVLQERTSIELKPLDFIFRWIGQELNSAQVARGRLSDQAKMVVGVFSTGINESFARGTFCGRWEIRFPIVAHIAAVIEVTPCESQLRMTRLRGKMIDLHSLFTAQPVIGRKAIGASMAEQFSQVAYVRTWM